MTNRPHFAHIQGGDHFYCAVEQKPSPRHIRCRHVVLACLRQAGTMALCLRLSITIGAEKKKTLLRG